MILSIAAGFARGDAAPASSPFPPSYSLGGGKKKKEPKGSKGGKRRRDSPPKCFLQIVKPGPAPASVQKKLGVPGRFELRHSHIGGIIDTRPVGDAELALRYDAPLDELGDDASGQAAPDIDLLGYTKPVQGCGVTGEGIVRPDLDMSFFDDGIGIYCYGPNVAAKVVMKLFGTVTPVININRDELGAGVVAGDDPHVTEVSNVGDVSDLDRLDRQSLLEGLKGPKRTKKRSIYTIRSPGHASLLICEKGKFYHFDSQEEVVRSSAKKFFAANPKAKRYPPLAHIEYLERKFGATSVYKHTKSAKCFNTRQHQMDNSSMCAVWSAHLTFLLLANPKRSLEDVLAYLGVKAYDEEYLHQKIRLFALYLTQQRRRLRMS